MNLGQFSELQMVELIGQVYILDLQWPLVSNFLSGNIAYMSVHTSSRNLFYKTTNLGSNWNFLFELNPEVFNMVEIYFLNENIGFSWVLDGNNSSKYFKSIDGGLTWNEVYSMTDSYRRTKFVFTNSNTGYHIAGQGIILQTTNQGDNWTQLKISDKEINEIDFLNENTGYIVGNDGFIKKTTNGGLIAIENISASIPENFILEQNYPNPFNPITKIKYSLFSSGNVKMTVYTILGKKVSELINEKQNAGSYEVEFNGNYLPSGIYFYELKAGEFIGTRKMVLLK